MLSLSVFLSLSLQVVLDDLVGWLFVDRLDEVDGRSRPTATILLTGGLAEDAGRLGDLGPSTESIEMLESVLTDQVVVHFDIQEHVEDMRVMGLRVKARGIATKP